MTVIGVPMETKNSEQRVAITPAGVQTLTKLGHRVLVELHAGEGSNFSNIMYSEAGAHLVSREQVWSEPDLIVKVKEPLADEIPRLHKNQVLFTYLHLAADKTLTTSLLSRNITCIAYETVQLANGSLPLLTPMSEIAGRLAVQVGATSLEKKNGGRGILLGGVVGVAPAHVVIIGAGVAGTNACQIARGMGARVTVLDINRERLQYVRDVLGADTLLSTSTNLAIVKEADLVISTVLIAGAKAPKLITRDLIKKMRAGSVIVDVSIDQGGTTEVSKATTHQQPTFMIDGVIMYCVANMPGAVPMSSTLALTNATLPYIVELAEQRICVPTCGHIFPRLSKVLQSGVNIYDNYLTNREVAVAHDMMNSYMKYSTT